MLKEKDLCKFLLVLLGKCKNIDTFSTVDVKKDLSDLKLNKKINPQELLSEAKAEGLIEYTYFYNKLTITILNKGKLYNRKHKEKVGKKIMAIITLVASVAAVIIGIIDLLC